MLARANTLAEWRGWTPFTALQVPCNLLRLDAERELIPAAEALCLSGALVDAT
jgi:aryl-alcohol dehydrogenase-like predicted oxidoreductase